MISVDVIILLDNFRDVLADQKFPLTLTLILPLSLAIIVFYAFV